MTSSSPRTTVRSRHRHGFSSPPGEDRVGRRSPGGTPGGRRGGRSPVPDLPDPDAIVAAIATCPSVSGLSGGIAGEVATYLPGRRVAGVRAAPGEVEVHVIARYGRALHDIDA